ncbi:hypothetical protein PEC18_05380 [Paucibacter sp. O1-1]|nr:hypothetical protein [Paucibacter sp. O1-1]MDA3825301.1 hypothetical protein [Paucibacter sp. O1-1]
MSNSSAMAAAQRRPISPSRFATPARVYRRGPDLASTTIPGTAFAGGSTVLYTATFGSPPAQ